MQCVWLAYVVMSDIWEQLYAIWPLISSANDDVSLEKQVDKRPFRFFIWFIDWVSLQYTTLQGPSCRGSPTGGALFGISSSRAWNARIVSNLVVSDVCVLSAREFAYNFCVQKSKKKYPMFK